LFAPVSAIVYEFDRRNKMTRDDLEEPEVDPTDHRAVAAKKEWVIYLMSATGGSSHSRSRDRDFRSFGELHQLIPDLLGIIGKEGTSESKIKMIYRQVSSLMISRAQKCGDHLIHGYSYRRVPTTHEVSIPVASSPLLPSG